MTTQPRLIHRPQLWTKRGSIRGMAIATRSSSIERAADDGLWRAPQAPKREVGVTHRASLEARKEPPTPPVSLETVAASWWSALDAAETALEAASASLTARELRDFSARLARERVSTAALLEEVARAEGVHAGFSHLLGSRPNLRRQVPNLMPVSPSLGVTAIGADAETTCGFAAISRKRPRRGAGPAPAFRT